VSNYLALSTTAVVSAATAAVSTDTAVESTAVESVAVASVEALPPQATNVVAIANTKNLFSSFCFYFSLIVYSLM